MNWFTSLTLNIFVRSACFWSSKTSFIADSEISLKHKFPLLHHKVKKKMPILHENAFS